MVERFLLAQFQSFQSLVTWLCCFWIFARRGRKSWQGECDGARYLTSWWARNGGRHRIGLTEHVPFKTCPSDLLPPTKPHILVFTTFYNSIKLWFSQQIRHWLSQNPHDPIVLNNAPPLNIALETKPSIHKPSGESSYSNYKTR
jgi:hypothetical protein